jgi:hypothetical protein
MTSYFLSVTESEGGPGYFSRYSDSLRTGRSGDGIPVGARYSAPVQTVPGAYPGSYTMGTGSFPVVKRPGRGVDHPPSSSAEVKGKSRAVPLLPPLGLRGLFWVDFYLYLYLLSKENEV